MEEDKCRAKEKFLASFRRWQIGEVDKELFTELLKTETAAHRGAAPAEGSFPRVIIAQGFSQSSLTHSILCEYLASHGYIVATSPSLGTNNREMTYDARGAETQVRDVEFIIDYLHTLPRVDHTKLAVAGFSFGGLPMLLVAMRNAEVDAAISFDSNLGAPDGLPILHRSPSFDLSRMVIPLLHFSQVSHPFLDFSLFDSLLFCVRTIIRINGLTHFDFSSFGMITATVPHLVKATRPNQQRGYEAQCLYALRFLDAHLKGDRDAQAFFRNAPEANGFLKDLLTVEHRDGQKPPPSIEEFVDLILEKGIDNAQQVYLEERKRVPGRALFHEDVLNRLGYEFLYAYGKTKEAIAVLEWNVEAYPESFNVYDSLGEAYLRDGQRELAIENYKKSLELNPENTNASDVLKRFGAE